MTVHRHTEGNEILAIKAIEEVLLGIDVEYGAIVDGFKITFKEEEVDGDEIDPEVIGYAHILLNEQRFVFYYNVIESGYINNIPLMAELVTRINVNLNVGGFELNFDNGKLRFKSCLDFTGTDLAPILVRNSFLNGIGVVEQHEHAILAVMHEASSPLQALNLIEQGYDD